MGELYADNGNGRLAPDRCSYDGPAGVELLTYVQSLINDGLAVYVGDNAGGADQLLKLADSSAPAAMALGTSAFLGTVIATLAGGLVPELEARGRRRRSDAGPSCATDRARRRCRRIRHRGASPTSRRRRRGTS